MESISPYRLTIIGALVVMVVSVGLLTILGGPQAASPYLGLVATVAIPALLTLFKQEQTANSVLGLHKSNTDAINKATDKLSQLTQVTEELNAIATDTNSQVAEVHAVVSTNGSTATPIEEVKAAISDFEQKNKE